MGGLFLLFFSSLPFSPPSFYYIFFNPIFPQKKGKN